MKKKYSGATKKTEAKQVRIPWRAVGIVMLLLSVGALAIWSYPKVMAFYANKKPHTTPKPQTLVQPEPPVFEFYTELTKKEADEYSRRAKTALSDLKKNQLPSYTCYVQAGSFSNITDAERTKAFLTLNGYLAVVRSVTLEDGRNRHRVILGPFNSINEAQDMQKNLYSFAGIQSVLLKSA